LFQENFKEFSSVLENLPQIDEENRQMSTCNWMDWETLGSRLIMPNNISPNFASQWSYLKVHQILKKIP
jgi:hypothetical protein